MVRRRYIFSGRVQGVGFRYKAYYSAQALGLTGYVKNLYDGRVEAEVQGDIALLGRFIAMIESNSYIRIEDIEMEDIPVIHENSFSIR